MKIAIFLVLTIGLVWPVDGRSERDSLVRVEVIVFQHVGGEPDGWLTRLTDDYSRLVDPKLRDEMTSLTAGSAGDWAEAPRFGDASSVSWPPVYVHIDKPSATVSQALRRLESSRDHRVLVSTSWLQSLSRGSRSRSVRLKGQELLFERPRPVPSLAGALSPTIGAATASPEAFYRLDGSLTLRQQQFRHVDLDLVWRELDPNARSVGMLSPMTTEAPEVLVHRLRLSRPIGLDRLEYFDSSWLGVLVFVQEWTGEVRAGATAQASEAPGDG